MIWAEYGDLARRERCVAALGARRPWARVCRWAWSAAPTARRAPLSGDLSMSAAMRSASNSSSWPRRPCASSPPRASSCARLPSSSWPPASSCARPSSSPPRCASCSSAFFCSSALRSCSFEHLLELLLLVGPGTGDRRRRGGVVSGDVLLGLLLLGLLLLRLLLGRRGRRRWRRRRGHGLGLSRLLLGDLRLGLLLGLGLELLGIAGCPASARVSSDGV